MSDQIDAFFQLLQSRSGLHPSGAATIALLIALLLAILSLFLFTKLKGMRALVYQVAERLDTSPPMETSRSSSMKNSRKGRLGAAQRQM